MMKDNGILRRILLAILLCLLILPYTQEKLLLFKETPLNGAITTVDKPLFSLSEWLEGTFQEKTESFLNQNFGFRTGLVRFNNQILYSIFNKAKAKDVIVGKESYLYESGYIDAINGINYLGDEIFAEKIRKIRLLSDTLSKMNKSLIIAIAPSKARFYTEYIPDNLLHISNQTNYNGFVKAAKDASLDIIDFGDYFIKSKDTSKYLLFPKLGTHWSVYGACLAEDSLIHYIERERHIDLRELQWSVDGVKRAYGTDYDIADGMNLLYRIRGPELAYPTLTYEKDSSKIQLKVVSIADSFYWMFMYNQIGEIFEKHQYWYYFNDIWPKSNDCQRENRVVADLDLRTEIDKNDVFIILNTESTVGGYGFGFIEAAYDLYYPVVK